MTRAVLLAAVLMLGLAAAAARQFPMVPFEGGSGPMMPGVNGMMVPNAPGEPAPPPVGCVGAADFSDGCAVAVFGH